MTSSMLMFGRSWIVAALIGTARCAEADRANPAPPTCNYSEEEDKPVFVKGASPPIFLPQDPAKLASFPAALDGSPYGFFHSASTTNSTKWTISIQGGGWCYDEVDCYCRSTMHYGTSKLLPAAAGCQCFNPLEDGSGADHDCNCIFLPYLDGASFTGHRYEPVPVPQAPGGNVPANTHLMMRGLANLDGAIEHALQELGLDTATELVVNGVSAGGLSTFLHVDRITAKVRAAAPSLKKVAAAPVVGYFLDHGNMAGSTGPTGPNTQPWSNISSHTAANYTTWMQYVYTMQNMTFGPEGGLSAPCRDRHPTEPHLCFMSPHMQDTITTPFFMFNSRFDEWQLLNELQTATSRQHLADDPAVQKAIIGYGADFLHQVAPVGGEGSHNGGFITTCICHGCPWPDLELDGKTADAHFADWFYGRSSGAKALHIDTRMPNGGGTLVGPQWKKCDPFPKQAAV